MAYSNVSSPLKKNHIHLYKKTPFLATLMVTLTCDACGYSCDHTKMTLAFAMAWLRSGRTKVAHCRSFGGPATCGGVLRSGLTDAEVCAQVRAQGYGDHL